MSRSWEREILDLNKYIFEIQFYVNYFLGKLARIKCHCITLTKRNNPNFIFPLSTSVTFLKGKKIKVYSSLNKELQTFLFFDASVLLSGWTSTHIISSHSCWCWAWKSWRIVSKFLKTPPKCSCVLDLQKQCIQFPGLLKKNKLVLGFRPKGSEEGLWIP